MLRRLLPVAAIAATALAASGVPGAERAGETTRVQPDSYQKTGAYPFNLRRGDEVYRDANIWTREFGSVSILFDDGTDLTLGPNTEVTVDEYVYAPGSAGRAAISFGKGMLRMVSGRMPPEGISIATPVATVGVRGTAFTLAIAAPGVRGWVEDGTVLATPAEATRTFAFSAPAAFVCSSSSCEQTDGRVPPPVAFPATPPGGGFGFGSDAVNDPEGAGDHGHDSSLE